MHQCAKLARRDPWRPYENRSPWLKMCRPSACCQLALMEFSLGSHVLPSDGSHLTLSS